ncbi:hypothetical protein V4F39_17605 [Aquincola sp. MAHUQ-54]|uniref:Cyclase dehydrase n=1 Tax=Aquincola agrisoli TaxID=3119538 RepID=A0AAW9QJE0_9BURK
MNTTTSDRAATLKSAPPRDPALHALARGLGFFSLALGLAELAMPGRMRKAAEIARRPAAPALPDMDYAVRACGLREAATGAGLLTAADPEPWVWGRVAGDVVDLVAVAASPRQRRLFGSGDGSRAGALVALLAVTALDVYCASALREERHRREGRPRDWGGRTGFPQSAECMRGAAADFVAPADLRTPEALRPWHDGRPAG